MQGRAAGQGQALPSTSSFMLSTRLILRGKRRLKRVRQRGVAVVTALLVTALAVTLVTDLFWQQQVQLRGLSGQRQRLQAKLVLRGALDGAAVALRESATTQGGATTADGAWARGTETGRPDAAGTDEDAANIGDDAAISQQIIDAQSRFNVRNLAKGGAIDPYAQASFVRLLTTLGDDPALAGVVARALLRSGAGDAGAGAAPLEITHIDDLATLPGITPAVLARLRAFIVLLPAPTAINVNTAPAEVLTAVATLSLPEARAVVRQRQQAHFRDTSDFALRLNSAQTLEGVSYAVGSDYFLVETAVRMGSTRLRSEALIAHPNSRNAPTALLWVHET